MPVNRPSVSSLSCRYVHARRVFQSFSLHFSSLLFSSFSTSHPRPTPVNKMYSLYISSSSTASPEPSTVHFHFMHSIQAHQRRRFRHEPPIRRFSFRSPFRCIWKVIVYISNSAMPESFIRWSFSLNNPVSIKYLPCYLSLC